MDDETWIALMWCANTLNTVLFVMTIGQRRALSPVATKALESFNKKKINVTEIEKWYYSGLACQILGVAAIPVELEK